MPCGTSFGLKSMAEIDALGIKGPYVEDFEEPDLLLLADAVQSSRFLTKRKADSLVRKLGKLAGQLDYGALVVLGLRRFAAEG